MKPAIVLVVVVALASNLLGGEALEAETDLFEIYVRPTLINRCIKCHGEEKQEGGLSLTSLESLQKGGDSGTAIDSGDSDRSLLLSAIRHESLEMPPDGRLDEETIKGIAAWVSAGAPWPEAATLKAAPKLTEKDKQWWCYQSIQDPPVPNCENNEWCRNEIDCFVLKKLSEHGLTPSQQATRAELLRRISFDLTGLPPKQSSLDEYEDNNSDVDVLIEELLNAQAYGEQQARFWLDLVRYADSDGYRADAERPHAKLYRDYVIDAMNDDLPYDQFILQQIAGDELFRRSSGNHCHNVFTSLDLRT